MNEHHRTALAYHCRFAFETAQAKFCHLTAGGKVSVMLTVNSGYE